MARRVHVVLDDALVEEIDGIAGPRGRSEYIAKAIEHAMDRERRLRLFDQMAGSLKPEHHIRQWDTPEGVSAWLTERRTSDRDPWAEAKAASDEAASNGTSEE